MKKLCMYIMLMCWVYICTAQPPVTLGLKLHLDAAKGFLSNGAGKATWADQSLSGNDMESGIGTREPVQVSSVYSTGFPGVRFDGVDDYMVNQFLNGTFSAPESTIFFVKVGHNYNASSPTPIFKAMISISEDSTILNEMGLISDWALHHSFGNNYSWQSHPCIDSLGDTIPIIHAAILGAPANDVKHMINGLSSPLSISSLNFPRSYTTVIRRLTLGARFHDNVKTNDITECFDGYVLEVIAYNRKLKPAEIALVNNYLFGKYYHTPVPTVTFTGDTVCNGGKNYLTFTEPGGPPMVSITYSDGSSSYGGLVPNGVPFLISPQPTTTTTYTLTGFSHGTSCRAITYAANISTVVGAGYLPIANAGPDVTLCSGRSILLAASMGAAGYEWLPGIGLSDSSISNPVASPTATITYTLRMFNGACADTDQIVVTVVPSPGAGAGPDTAICGGAQVHLQGSGAGSYTWYPAGSVSDPAISDPVITAKKDTRFTLVVTAANGCTDTDRVDIIVHPEPVFGVTPADADVCAGKKVSFKASGGDSYSWYPPTGLSSISLPTVTVTPDPLTPQMRYTVDITNDLCKVTKTLSVNVTTRMKPAVTIEKRTSEPTCSSPTIVLEASGAAQYQWLPAHMFDKPLEAIATATTDGPVTVNVIGTSIYGCSDTASVSLAYKPMDSVYLMIPTVFSPNGDGKNDYFRVQTRFAPESYSIIIYNRWGNKIFEGTDLNSPWDGTSDGKSCDVGVYNYFLIAKTKSCGTIRDKGTVHLVR